jgi:hypothetical protein
MSTPVPPVDFISHGLFCIVKRKWVRFGITPIEKSLAKFWRGVFGS